MSSRNRGAGPRPAAAPAHIDGAAGAGTAPGEASRRIRIDQDRNPGGKEAALVSVNGVAMCIPRNREAVVAARYVEALKNAVAAVYEDDERIDAPAYPFSDLGPA